MLTCLGIPKYVIKQLFRTRTEYKGNTASRAILRGTAPSRLRPVPGRQPGLRGAGGVPAWMPAVLEWVLLGVREAFEIQ